MNLSTIGQRMVEQDNRGTRYPLYVVQEDFRRYVPYQDDWDGRERIEEIDDSSLCRHCSQLYTDGDVLPDDCDHCGTDAFYYYKDEERLAIEKAGVFFTEKACKQHIKENSYHYKNPRVYVIGAWRNPEMAAVMQDLVKWSGSEVPSYYQ